jgi:hypothetical protein
MKGQPDSTAAPMVVEYEYEDDVRNAEAPPPYTAEELTGSIPQPGDTGVTSKYRVSLPFIHTDFVQTTVALTST